ncbi:MAG: DUF4271 domain-containing protein [Bacteroidetes bacterium]|nr:DUF4271 domain-containing protein [Bacteroidota bacterium]
MLKSKPINGRFNEHVSMVYFIKTFLLIFFSLVAGVDENKCIAVNPESIIYSSLESDVNPDLISDQPVVVQQRKLKPEYWISIVLLLIISLATFVLVNFKKKINALVRGLFNIALAEQIYREQRFSLISFNTVLSLIFSLTMGLYGYLLLKYFNLNTIISGLLLYIVCCTFIAVIYFVKNVMNQIIAYIFPFNEILGFYNFNILLLNRLLGILLIPLLIMTVYTSEELRTFFILSIIILVISFILYRYARGVTIGLKYIRFHKFYFFLYLCTLEIAPVLIIYKLLSDKLY